MKIHFVGLGGISMSGVARYFKAKGFAISGSDLRAGPLTSSLMREGIRIKIGMHVAANLPKDADLLIYNRAIPLDNPELVAARKRNVPLLPLAEALGRLTEMHKTIAITGSHGKSTTTALASILFMKAGLDPTIFIGTNLNELEGKNVRIGKSPWLVLEADDFGRAFLSYSPTVVIVTNIDREHLDFYKSFLALKASFLQFLSRTHEHGTLILNRDDEVLFSLRARVAVIAKKKHLHVVWYTLQDPATRKIKRALRIPGRHNLSNAIAVYRLGKILQIPQKKILAALGAYRGSWRRMEERGTIRMEKKTIRVFDDYAHHPTEIRATLQAFREKFPHAHLACVFQPHQTERLRLLFKEFADSFMLADSLTLLPAYRVAGRDMQNPKFTAEKLAQAIKRKYPRKDVRYLADPKQLKRALLVEMTDIAQSEAVVVMMGAGDIVNYTDSLLK
ncbi:MAG TPA: UDP-N-acetylmuramate--L-alanine ligase [Candidatus Paceibacterota bacterium]|jgi:UDP-N-acetylmuramate--alanine ligase|nr:UDP-N-acetylmuramate--L-alanine ligase [Candidatus Paceibacterota bacterium]